MPCSKHLQNNVLNGLMALSAVLAVYAKSGVK